MKRIALVLLSVTLSLPVWSTDYQIDPAHSSVGFHVRHLVSQVHGSFMSFEGAFSYDPAKPESSKAEAVVKTASINTNNPKRDDHLRSADFFEVSTYPTMTFVSNAVKNLGADHLEVAGTLTLHGIAKPVTLDVQVGGVTKDPWGGTRSGFTATAKINRKDFHIDWNKALDNGGLLVGDDVMIEIAVEGVAKK